MDVEKNKYKVFLDEIIKSTNRVVVEYGKRVVILSEEDDPNLLRLTKRLDDLNLDYLVSLDGVPIGIVNPYAIHLRQLDFC